MSNRLPIEDNLCTNTKNHHHHICELKAAKKTEQLELLSVNPQYICGNCASLSNDQETLCAPGPFQK